MARYIEKGQLIIELLVAFGLSSIFIPAIILGFISGSGGRAQTEQRIQATGILKEEEEAVRSVREASWGNIGTNGTYHPILNGNSWQLSSGDITLNGFTRSIVISDVTPVDPSRKKIDLNVSWGTMFPSTVSTTIYLTRHLSTTYTETTKAQFDLGTKTHVATTDVAGGEVVLSGGGHGDWCVPDLTLASLDLPKNGVANAITAIPATATSPGYAFAGTGENASGVSFAKVNITDTDPPVATIPNPGTFDGFKTNGVFGEANYAYLATDTNGKQGEIIDLNKYDQLTGKYLSAGSLDLGSGSINGASIVVRDNLAYMSGTDGKLYIFDVTDRSGSHLPISNISLDATANKIKIVGNNIYAAENSATTQLQIIPLTNNGRSFGAPISIGVDGLSGKDVYENLAGTRAYLATAASATKRELFIVNTDSTSPGYKSTLSSYDTNGMDPKGVVTVTNNKAIIVGIGGVEYQVVDVANDVITSCGAGLNVDTGINGVASVIQPSGSAYSYIITGDASTELKIIEGGPSGLTSSSGNFESSTFDAGSEVAFNRFVATTTIPPGTNITFQFAGAHAVSGSCSGATFTYVTPNADGSIPTSSDGTGFENPARCFRYKAYFTSSDPNATAVLSDITINYSP